MKKIVLLPKTDTIILCLPEKWVGTPIICKLEPMNNRFIDNEEATMEVEIVMNFHNFHKRKRKK